VALTENDCFCLVDDVEALVGRGAFSVSTVPTEQQVIDTMARRAAALEVVLASIGVAKTVSTGSAPLLATGADARLYRLCGQANAYLAAADAILMNQTRDTVSVPEKAKAYLAIADDIVATIRAAGRSDATGQDVDRSFVTDSTDETDDDYLPTLDTLEF
jgi:hypothetical protein